MIVVNGRAGTGAPVMPWPRAGAARRVDARGVAVAVDGGVVPRARWGTFALPADARVEVLTAMQGG